jgi:putative flippase GtrA
MPLPAPLAAVVSHLRTPEGRKKLNYLGVSAVFVPVGQLAIQLLGRFVFDRNYTKASVASAAILTLPNFFANKYFVWRNTSRDNLRTQVAVFWVAAMFGVAFATYLTWLVEKAVKGRSGLVESGAVFLAQLVGFGLVWVIRFLVLDKWLFKVTHHGTDPSADEAAMLHADVPV